MELRFLGANRQVTGSKHYLEAAGARILIDCGMYQERQFSDRNWEPCPVKPSSLDAVLITHAHLDHCGLLPRLVHEGFRGQVLTTAPSAELVELILRDSAKIQAEDVAYKKKRHKKEGRHGKHPEQPLYTMRDVERTLKRIEPVKYEKAVAINGSLTVTFHDAGHILGSAIIEINATEGDLSRRLLFTGDLGQVGKPIVRDPIGFAHADYVVLESTYGDRTHPTHEDIETQLAEMINVTIEAGGNVLIPTFAVERSQELMYFLGRLVRDGRIPQVPIFLDSPMAIDVTEVFRRHRDCFDEEAWDMIDDGLMPLSFPGLHMARTVEESKEINRVKGPKIIMASSGMCTAGRIKHHLCQNIAKAENTILFVGYQAHGTLGRKILEGNPEVRIHGRPWPVRATVHRIDGFSGHADQAALLDWLGHLGTPPRQVFLVHGEEEDANSLGDAIRQTHGFQVTVPQYQERLVLE